MTVSHYLFKCPFNFDFLSEFDKRRGKCVENNYHRLKWSAGHTAYSELDKILAPLKGLFLSKGGEKCDFLRNK